MPREENNPCSAFADFIEDLDVDFFDLIDDPEADEEGWYGDE